MSVISNSLFDPHFSSVNQFFSLVIDLNKKFPILFAYPEDFTIFPTSESCRENFAIFRFVQNSDRAPGENKNQERIGTFERPW